MSRVKKNIKTFSFFEKIYYKLVPFHKRYGKVFCDHFNFLMQSINWSNDKINEYQNNCFLNLINHCFSNVAYYKKKFSEYGYTKNTFKSLDDLKKIPRLTKDDILNNFDDLIADNYRKKKLFKNSTSGTSGKKLSFLIDDDTFKIEAAFVLRSIKINGGTMYDKPSIWLRRYVPENNKSPLWYYDHELRRLYISAYHINDNTVQSYISEINKNNYHTLFTYPSSAYILANICEKNNIYPDIKAIHLASENIQENWIKKIIEVFKIIPTSHYGSMEKVIFMHKKKYDHRYVPNLEYGAYNFIKKKNTNIYNVEASGFINYAMPFLGYHMEDEYIILDDKFKFVDKINGRSTDILVSKDGTNLPCVNFFSWIDKQINGIGMFQIIQKKNKDIIFNYTKDSKTYDLNTDINIQKGLKQRIGNVKITINQVNEIKRDEKTGKIKTIVREK